MVITTTDTALLRLLQLASPALPVGAYAFSQGLESAIELRWLHHADDACDWLTQQLTHAQALLDLPVLLQLHTAWQQQDHAQVQYWNAYLLAARETAELRLAETATGDALTRLLPALGLELPCKLETPTFAALFAFAAVHWQLPPALTLHGYAWAWLENQVVAVTKLLPLGQSQAQVLLGRVQALLPLAVDVALHLDADDIGATLPGLALASIRHETQYSRLFRS